MRTRLCSQPVRTSTRTARLEPPPCHRASCRSTPRNTAARPHCRLGRCWSWGNGQTGCQLAEELQEADREVFLACGRAPWCSRRIGGRDVVYWINEIGMFDQTLADLPSPFGRLIANVQATGHARGHDLHYRVLQQIGVTLVGHFLGAETSRALFASDLATSVAFGDQRYSDMRKKIVKLCSARGIPTPEMPDPTPFDACAHETVDLRAKLAGKSTTQGGRQPQLRLRSQRIHNHRRGVTPLHPT
jgi:putative flavoprotein involved in K+ transport